MADLKSLSKASQNLGNIEINLVIRNNRNYTQSANVMGSPYGGGGSVNATIEYRWNFTAYIFNTSNSTLTLEYKGSNSVPFSLFSVSFGGSTPEAVAQTLNQIGISTFSVYTEAGQTYVSTYNDTTIFGELDIISTAVSISQDMVTQSGQFLVTENNVILSTEVASTTMFPVQIINYPAGDPAISVTISEGAGSGGTSGVTYEEVQQAFVQNNYEVQGLYLYSNQIENLNSTVTYNSYDASGNKTIAVISNVLDPNQFISASLIDLSSFKGGIVLNGNSFMTPTILPNNTFQMKFLMKAINTNSQLSSNFLEMENLTNTKFFEPNNGSISEFERNDALILGAIPEEIVDLRSVDKLRISIANNVERQNQENQPIQNQVEPSQQKSAPISEQLISNNYVPLIFVSAALLAGAYLIFKKKN
jgi:hypothetical protein